MGDLLPAESASLWMVPGYVAVALVVAACFALSRTSSSRVCRRHLGGLAPSRAPTTHDRDRCWARGGNSRRRHVPRPPASAACPGRVQLSPRGRHICARATHKPDPSALAPLRNHSRVSRTDLHVEVSAGSGNTPGLGPMADRESARGCVARNCARGRRGLLDAAGLGARPVGAAG